MSSGRIRAGTEHTWDCSIYTVYNLILRKLLREISRQEGKYFILKWLNNILQLVLRHSSELQFICIRAGKPWAFFFTVATVTLVAETLDSISSPYIKKCTNAKVDKVRVPEILQLKERLV